MAGTYTLSKFLKPFADKITATPDQTIGQVLELADTSHQPIYVMKGKKYLGVVSVYDCLYNHNFPFTKKVESSLVKTPHIYTDTPLFFVLRDMMDTRLYELPILDRDDKIIGVVTMKDIFQTLLADKLILEYVASCVNPRTPITAPYDSRVEDAYHALKKHKISRIILTDEKGKVHSIVARNDIKPAFIRPNLRQRFRGKAEERKQNIFDPKENIYRDDDPVARYAKDVVYVHADTTPVKTLIRDLIDSGYNSVVLVDKNDHPTGFFSMRDILECLAKFEPVSNVPIVFEKPHNGVPEAQVEKAIQKVEKMIKKLQKMYKIEKTEVNIKEQKYTNQKVGQYETHIIVGIPGNNIVATTQKREYLESVTAAIELVEKQAVKQAKQYLPNKNSPPPM